jgi:hypothetical protein
MIGLDTRRRFVVSFMALSFSPRGQRTHYSMDRRLAETEPIWTMWRKYRFHCRESKLGGPARSQIVY